MKLLEVSIRLKSPAIIPSKQTKEGYVKPLDYLPGSTVRGAVISSLYFEKLLSEEDLRREAKEPSILASPAYPVVDGFRSLPATPFIGKCKLCGEMYDSTEENVRRIMEGEDPTFHSECERCGALIEPLYSKLLTKHGKVNIKVFRSTSVGIDKRRGTSAKGMLFDYEAIEEGIEFWGRIRVPNNIEIDGLEIFIGRGASRGFGHAVINVLGEYNNENRRDEIFYALSPIIPVKAISTSVPCKVTVKIRKIYGRCRLLQTGWDIEKSKRRPIINTVERGAIVIAEFSDIRPEISAVGIPFKIGEFWITGLNVLIPISEYLNEVK